jgi:hypothetical protein
MKHYVIVIGHHGISTDIDGEDFSQLLEALFNPATAVFVAFA